MLTSLFMAALVAASPDFPTSAAEVRPLLIGSALPAANVRALDGKSRSLSEVHGGKPTVLVVYRGGWCPFCTIQLSNLNAISNDLDALGYQIVALSPDSPESLSATLSKEPLDYQLYSDSQLEVIDALGIGFRLDDQTVEQLDSYGIDLNAATGTDALVLPVPSVFVIDAKGVIQFHYINPDYRVRVPEKLILAAAQAALEIKPLR